MKILKTMMKNILRKFGYRISRIEKPAKPGTPVNPYCPISMKAGRIVDLESISAIAESVPGMIARQSGQHLYALCYFQREKGDVVEVGSWQGRSASFLARAVRESGNGHFHSIDHFLGNVGKEHFYVVKKKDLSDLAAGFEKNMERIGLSDSVHLLNMPNEQAAEKLAGAQVRFLFIDGDHTRNGVKKDIDLFFPIACGWSDRGIRRFFEEISRFDRSPGGIAGAKTS